MNALIPNSNFLRVIASSWLILIFTTTALADDAVRQAAAKIEPCLVRIETFGGTAQADVNPGEGPTTGVLYSSDGYILTSTFNFIRKPPVITVTLSDGSRHVAQLLGRDEHRKLCVLKIDGASDLPTPAWLSMNDMQVGQWAISAGVGYGPDQPAISIGIVSGLNRIHGIALQTDANTSPANYGGPLIDLDGRVLGIIIPLQPGAESPAAGAEWYDSGVGFAVPIADISAKGGLIDRMKRGETLNRGWIGVRLVTHEADPPGVNIAAVAPDSPAQKADLRVDDVITHVNGRPIANVHELRRALARHAAGDTIILTIHRDESAEGGQEVALTLTATPSE